MIFILMKKRRLILQNRIQVCSSSKEIPEKTKINHREENRKMNNFDRKLIFKILELPDIHKAV